MNFCQVKKLIITSLLLGLVFPSFLFAQEKGIGVSPAEISVGANIDWPYTVPVTVTNFSEEQEQFEVFLENQNNVAVTASPGRFLLEGGRSKRVLITFEESAASAKGLVKVLSTKASAQGFTTGTGVRIPFSVAGSSQSKLLASTNDAGGSFPYVFGAGVILASLVLLWQIAGIIRPWLANSNKQ